MDELMKEAKRLEASLDTDWAEEHAAEYDAFEDRIESAYAAGLITGAEFNELVLTAFYDWPGDLKDE